MDWDIGVLGSLQLRRDGRTVPLGGAAGWVLGRLAAEPGRVVALPDLMSALWGDDLPGGPAKAVQSYVSRLRSVAGPDLVLTQRPGYLLAVEPDQVDAVRFAKFVAKGRSASEAGAHAAAVGRLDLAERLWRGEAYADLPDLPYVRRERIRLRDLRVAAREYAIGAKLSSGAEAEPIVEELEELLGSQPLREQLWAHLVMAHYRAGRQAEALAAYQRARSVLVRDLGVEPGPVLREAERRVLGQEPFAPAFETKPLGLFVGREATLSDLVDRLDEAAFGTPQGILLRGRPGSGKTRLLEELTTIAAARGAVIRRDPVVAPTDRYTVYALDDIDHLSEAETITVARRWAALNGPVMLVAAAADPVDLGLHEIALPPLEQADIATIVRLYASDEDSGELAESLAGQTIAEVHERAAAWAVERAVARVGSAVATLTIPAGQARQARAQVLAGVAELSRLRKARTPHQDRCPYPGLGRFDADDAAYFHGRERATADLIARLAAAEPGEVIAIVGPSGSGKSSLVRAGVLAALADGALPGSADWRIQVHEPSRSAPEGPADLIVIDQFEELFTVLDTDARKAYTEKIARTARVVITLRSDYLAAVSDDPACAPMVAANPVLVARPSLAELTEMVRGPAAAVGVQIEPGLIDDIVEELGQQRHLPLLCTALAALWRTRSGDLMTRAALRENGGVAAAVEQLGESAYAAMDPLQQEAAHRMLLRLADLDESGPIRRPERRANLLEVGDPTALDILTAHRLVVVDADLVEITHEALLSHWPRLAAWIEADAAGRHLRRAMIHAADQWRHGREPADLYRGARLAAAREWAADHGGELTPTEREFLTTSIRYAERGHRRMRLFSAVIATGLVLAITAAFVAVAQWRRADAAALSADVRRLAAMALTEPNVRLSMLEAVSAVRLDPSTTTSYGLLAALQRIGSLVAVAGNESGDPQRAMALSTDGSLLAVGSRTGRVEVYADRRPAGTWTAEGIMPIRGMRFLSGARLAVWGDQSFRVFEPRTGGALGPAVPKPQGITAELQPDGHTMVLAGLDDFLYGTQQPVRLWDLADAKPLRELAPAGRFTSISSDATLAGPGGVAIVDHDRLVRLRDQPSTIAARNPTSREVAAATGATLTVWGSQVRQAIAAGAITDLAYAADGRSLIGGGDRHIAVWDTQTLTPRLTATVPAGGIARVALAPDGRYAYATGTDGAVYTWLVDDPLTTGTAVATSKPLPAAGCDSEYSTVLPMPDAVMIGCDNVSLVDYSTGAVESIALPEPPTTYASGDGRLLAGFLDGSVLEVAPAHRLLSDIGAPVVSMAVRGDLLAVAGGNRLRIQRGDQVLIDAGRDEDPSGMAISRDGRYLALGMYARVEVVEVPSLRPVASFDDADGINLFLVAFSDDGRDLLIGGQSGRVQLVDTRTWQRRWMSAGGPSGFTVSVSFGSDGRTVVSGGADGRVLVLDRQTGTVLAGFGPGGRAVVPAVVHGSEIIAVFDLTRIRAYRVDPSAWIDRACAIAGRDLTADEWTRLLPNRSQRPVCPVANG